MGALGHTNCKRGRANFNDWPASNLSSPCDPFMSQQRDHGYDLAANDLPGSRGLFDASAEKAREAENE
jgi:hypothetical protein